MRRGFMETSKIHFKNMDKYIKTFPEMFKSFLKK